MNRNLLDGFTLTEVIILLVIFMTVAVLVIPLSVEDAVTTKNVTKWRHVQNGFTSIPITMMDNQSYKQNREVTLEHFISALIKVHPLKNVINYKIKYLNGETPDEMYTFKEIYNTNNGASLAFKWFDENHTRGEDKIEGLLMYDVNGKHGPNVWGKDVFGFNIYANKIEPLGKNQDPITIESDCSRQGTGVYCSFALLRDEIQEP